MQIILATSSFSQKGGGISSYANDFVDVYDSEHSLTVVTGDNYQKTDYDNFELYNVEWDNLSIRNAKKIICLINEINPDIIINSNALLISLISPYLRDSIKIISVSHFVNGQLAHTAGFNSKYIDFIVSLSEYGSDYLTEKFNIKNSEKVYCIYNFLEQRKNVESLIDKKKFQNRLTIVYPGGSSPHKSPDIIFKVVKSLLETDLEFSFFWLGDTTLPLARFSSKFKTIKEMFEYDTRLTFTNLIPRTKAIEIIESANVFLLPSRGEGCPISLLEAIRVGTIPIVSDSHHASRELIENDINGYIIPINNIESYTQRIQDIILNPKKYDHIYYTGLKYFTDNLNSVIWKRKMDELFYKSHNHHKRLADIPFYHFLINRFIIRYTLKIDRIKMILRNIKLHLFFKSVFSK